MFVKTLPNMFTVGNLFLGIIAIIFAFHDQWQYAAMMVIIGMFLDGLDGRVARMLNAQSEFGKELDSLSDVVSFGVAPALIMNVAVLHDMGVVGWIITAVFPICGALRLARFNVEPGLPGFFIGLPITAAGGVLATMALYSEMTPSPLFHILGMLLLSYLMISRVRYPNFKNLGMPRRIYWVILLFLVVTVVVAARYPEHFPKFVFFPLAIYAAYGLKQTVHRRRQRNSEEPAEELKP